MTDMIDRTKTHSHYCEMSDRVKSCHGKVATECDNFKENKECFLPIKLGYCDNHECRLVAQLDFYKNALEESKAEISKLKLVNTQFRTIMLMPAQAERLLKQGAIDFSGINSLIAKQRTSWDSCDEETILYMLEYTQKFSEAYAQYLAEKSTKIQVKDFVEAKKKKETKIAQAKLAAQEEIKDNKPKPPSVAKTPFQKSLANYMKIGMTEEAARATLLAMGYKE